jgi:hypothetical protein
MPRGSILAPGAFRGASIKARRLALRRQSWRTASGRQLTGQTQPEAGENREFQRAAIEAGAGVGDMANRVRAIIAIGCGVGSSANADGIHDEDQRTWHGLSALIAAG